MPSPRPLVFVGTGQSNAAIQIEHAWAPSSNVQVWNGNGGGEVGTAFGPIPNTHMNVMWKTASEIGAVLSEHPVYLGNFGFGGLAISH